MTTNGKMFRKWDENKLLLYRKHVMYTENEC